MPDHHRILILGGGTAGITVAARLRRAAARLDIGIVEPSESHFYQPLWTLVGAGVFPPEASRRREADFIPAGVDWIRDRVTDILPDQKAVATASGRRLTYDWLIVALGIQIDWTAIPGLAEGIGTRGICSNYSFEHVTYTWETIRGFTGGTALFTVPNTAVKCGGAPQKIMYLADDAFRRQGVRDRTQIVFASPAKAIFAVEKYRKTLEQVVARKGIDARFRQNLVELRPDAHEAVFEHLDTHERSVVPYDMIHVTPPMSAPDVIKRGPLANEQGWCAADKLTLRHPRYPDVFALGDAAGLPTSKTGAAIRKQAPVLVHNLLAAMNGAPCDATYDGYTSCPVVTGYGRMVLAEFDYDNKPKESFPIDQSKERYSMWLLKTQVLPRLYWHGMLRGRV
ncbi:MAG: Sulfide dehydrogenase [flavocytochrome c] flavoprotein chain precursor [Planctomycetota bacterium]|jgi:sulfide:quinone oxidoreductase